MSNALRFNLILVSLVFVVVFFVVISITPELTPRANLASPYCSAPTEIPPLDAEAAYALDVRTGRELFVKNADAQLPLASLTKTITALTAEQFLPLDSYVRVMPEALAIEGESGLIAGEEWLVRDLIDFTLIESSNDGARALALGAAQRENQDIAWFHRKMNEYVAEAGATQMFFLNDSGLDVSSSTAGAYGSARDVALLLSVAQRGASGVLEGSSAPVRSFRTLDGKTHTAENTSTVPSLISGARISKTGYTDLAGGNLGVVFDAIPGTPVVAVVLGSTREGRDEAMLMLVEAVKSRVKVDALCSAYSAN